MFQTRPRPGVLTLGISLAIVKSPTLKGITERGLLDPGFGYERSRGMAEGLGKSQKGSLSLSLSAYRPTNSKGFCRGSLLCLVAVNYIIQLTGMGRANCLFLGCLVGFNELFRSFYALLLGRPICFLGERGLLRSVWWNLSFRIIIA